MRTHLRDSRPPTRPTHCRGDRAGRDRLEGCPGLQEHLSRVALWPTSLEIAGDRLAHIYRQRQPVLPSAFAVHHQLAGPPVDVIQQQAGHLVPAQPKSHQHDNHGVVPSPQRGASIARTEQRADLRRGDPLRQRRAAPAGHSKRRLRQITVHHPLEEAEPQERSQRGDEVLRGAHRHRRRPAEHRCGHLRRRQASQRLIRSEPVQEPADVIHVPAHRAGGQATLGTQVMLKGAQQDLCRRRRHRRLLTGRNPCRLKHVQQAQQTRT